MVCFHSRLLWLQKNKKIMVLCNCLCFLSEPHTDNKHKSVFHLSLGRLESPGVDCPGGVLGTRVYVADLGLG